MNLWLYLGQTTACHELVQRLRKHSEILTADTVYCRFTLSIDRLTAALKTGALIQLMGQFCTI